MARTRVAYVASEFELNQGRPRQLRPLFKGKPQFSPQHGVAGEGLTALIAKEPQKEVLTAIWQNTESYR